MRPDLSQVPAFFHNYINQVPQDNLAEAFRVQSPRLLQAFRQVPAEKRDYRYGEGKWTVKEMLQHIIDAERVFGYRAMCIARGESLSLPAFDENLYAENSKASRRNWDEMIEELECLRKSSEYLFLSFDDDQLDKRGLTNNNPIGVLALGYIVVGHAVHHTNVLEERYLSKKIPA